MAEERLHKKAKTDHSSDGKQRKGKKAYAKADKGKQVARNEKVASAAHGESRGGRGGRGGRGRSELATARGGARGRGRGGRGKGPHRPAGASENQAEPGVNKLKASIRQVKRLLAKPNLAPDVQQEAERRLKALEEDVRDRLEGSARRAWDERWKKVRFFERQKVMRKIKQLTKRHAATAKDGDAEATELQERLTEAREWLNYIIHFPTSEPYLPLFASGFPSPFGSTSSRSKSDADSSDEADSDDDKRASGSKAKPTTAPATAEQLARRLAVRDRMRAAMFAGTMSNQPEVDLEAAMREGTANALGADTKKRKRSTTAREGGRMGEGNEGRGDESKEGDDDEGLKGDAFFEGADDSDEDEE